MSTTARRIGLYPGTFDPVTHGHLDIIRRSMKLVDHLVVGVAISEAKGPMFSLEERVEMVQTECAPLAKDAGVTVSVEPFDNLLVHFAEEVGADIIVRGLRAVADFEYEFQMVGMNRILNPNIELVFLMAGPEHQAIASRLVKEVSRFGGDVSKFVTPGVNSMMKTRNRR